MALSTAEAEYVAACSTSCEAVWQYADGIFLGQGKCAVEILKRLGMMDYKAITTPMASNLKLLSDASSKAFDAMMYH